MIDLALSTSENLLDSELPLSEDVQIAVVFLYH